MPEIFFVNEPVQRFSTEKEALDAFLEKALDLIGGNLEGVTHINISSFPVGDLCDGQLEAIDKIVLAKIVALILELHELPSGELSVFELLKILAPFTDGNLADISGNNQVVMGVLKTRIKQVLNHIEQTLPLDPTL